MNVECSVQRPYGSENHGNVMTSYSLGSELHFAASIAPWHLARHSLQWMAAIVPRDLPYWEVLWLREFMNAVHGNKFCRSSGQPAQRFFHSQPSLVVHGAGSAAGSSAKGAAAEEQSLAVPDGCLALVFSCCAVFACFFSSCLLFFLRFSLVLFARCILIHRWVLLSNSSCGSVSAAEVDWR